MDKIVTWIKNNRKEAVLLGIIILVAAFFRLWRIDEYLPFLGDEGRDVRVVRRLILEFDPILIGPRTSIGDMYLGPLYYYLIAPFLAFFRFSPAGPASFVALLGTATVGFVWLVAREWFGKVAGIVAALFYAVSPVVITLSKHSWNPNIMPFFALLSIYSIWRVWKYHAWKWLIILGVSYAFVLQSHYLGLLLGPTIGLVWLVSWWETRKKAESRSLLRYSFFSLLVFLFLMSPLVIFDARHGWRNFAAMEKFFTERQTTVSAKPWNALPNLWPLWQDHVVERLVVGKNQQWAPLAAVLILAGVIFTLSAHSKVLYSTLEMVEKPLAPFTLTVVWISVGLVGLGVYKQTIFDHYFGFMFAAPFLLVGALAQELWKRRFKWLVLVLVIALGWTNLQENPLKYPPQRQMQRVETIDRKIIEEAGGEPFNFALIAKQNYEEGYLYFFELWGAPVREIDAQRIDETLVEQLFVVCEDSPSDEEPEPCNPINHSKAEIANFGWAKIEQEWEVNGVKLFKLIHTDEQEN